MLKTLSLSLLFFCLPIFLSAQEIERHGTARRIVVDGHPMIMLAGELGNSSAASVSDLERVFPIAKSLNLNTVLLPAYWELLEPREGEFDFSLIDKAVQLARQFDIKLVYLWFGSWKNSMSCYVPEWVKTNRKRFPYAQTADGKTLEMMSAFSRNNLEADSKAFTQFMKHLSDLNRNQHTVIMVQVENEIGMLTDARDYSKEANAAFVAQVPATLTNYLKKNKATLHPYIKDRWEANGSKTSGTWTDLFGSGIETDELFMAYYYAQYVEQIASAGRKAYNVPLYLNAALDSRERKPGAYPAAGPLAKLVDVWKAAAPSIDILAPDVYDPGFRDWCTQYDMAEKNPLFMPEIRLDDANAARVFYIIGEHSAMGFSPFSIEDTPGGARAPLARSYDLLHQLMPMILQRQGGNKMFGLNFDNDYRERIVDRNGIRFSCRHDYTLGWNPEALDGSAWPESGAIVLEITPTEYIVAGTGVVLTFAPSDGKGNVWIGKIDEVKMNNGEMQYIRRLNGDQNHQGRHLRIPVGVWNIQYVKLIPEK